MGRRPIHDEAMSATERQRRRRARLRSEPWRDQHLAVRAIVQALRDLQGEDDGVAALGPQLVAQICDQAVAGMALEDAAAQTAARETVAKLLDPGEPLPERGQRGRCGHRRDAGMRRRHGRRDKDTGPGETDQE